MNTNENMNTSPDRTVHCTIVPPTGPRIEIVRYVKAGAWYWECGDRRRKLRLLEAVAYAADERDAVIWHEGLPGGRSFDRHVRLQRALARGLKEGAAR